jgi:hypothetical protein
MDPSLVEKPWPFSESLFWSALLNVLSGSFIFKIHVFFTLRDPCFMQRMVLGNVDSLNSETW